MNVDLICPRCEHLIPNDETPGAYPGAISRVDNKTEICSKCGTDEAMENFFGDGLTPIHKWPIVSYEDITNELHNDISVKLKEYNERTS